MEAIFLFFSGFMGGAIVNQAIHVSSGKNGALLWVYFQAALLYMACRRAKSLSKRVRLVVGAGNELIDYLELAGRAREVGEGVLAAKYLFWQRVIIFIGASFFGEVFSQLVGGLL